MPNPVPDGDKARPRADAEARAIAAFGVAAQTIADAAPVVTFRGWVTEKKGEDDDATFRCYTDPWMLEWYEIPVSGLVHQLKGEDREHDDRRSVIWVKAGASVKRWRCQTARAAVFAGEGLEGGEIPDPAGGPEGYGGGGGGRPP